MLPRFIILQCRGGREGPSVISAWEPPPPKFPLRLAEQPPLDGLLFLFFEVAPHYFLFLAVPLFWLPPSTVDTAHRISTLASWTLLLLKYPFGLVQPCCLLSGVFVTSVERLIFRLAALYSSTPLGVRVEDRNFEPETPVDCTPAPSSFFRPWARASAPPIRPPPPLCNPY